MGEDSPPNSSLHFTNSYILRFVFAISTGSSVHRMWFNLCLPIINPARDRGKQWNFINGGYKRDVQRRNLMKLQKTGSYGTLWLQRPGRYSANTSSSSSLKIVTFYSLKKSDKMTDLSFRPLPFYFKMCSLYFSMQVFLPRNFL